MKDGYMFYHNIAKNISSFPTRGISPLIKMPCFRMDQIPPLNHFIGRLYADWILKINKIMNYYTANKIDLGRGKNC